MSTGPRPMDQVVPGEKRYIPTTTHSDTWLVLSSRMAWGEASAMGSLGPRVDEHTQLIDAGRLIQRGETNRHTSVATP